MLDAVGDTYIHTPFAKPLGYGGQHSKLVEDLHALTTTMGRRFSTGNGSVDVFGIGCPGERRGVRPFKQATGELNHLVNERL